MTTEVKNQEDVDCFNSTAKHIEFVKRYMQKVLSLLQQRAGAHDKSKLKEPEFELFAKYTPELAGLTYGSDEYKECISKLAPALEHHYAKNRHHPEHFKNGIRDMNLIDIIEMFVDWYCAAMRHNNGNIRRSIEYNQERFDFSDDITKIFYNTIEILDISN